MDFYLLIPCFFTCLNIILQLLWIFGALMWFLGKVLNTPEVAHVYNVGLFSFEMYIYQLLCFQICLLILSSSSWLLTRLFIYYMIYKLLIKSSTQYQLPIQQATCNSCSKVPNKPFAIKAAIHVFKIEQSFSKQTFSFGSMHSQAIQHLQLLP